MTENNPRGSVGELPLPDDGIDHDSVAIRALV